MQCLTIWKEVGSLEIIDSCFYKLHVQVLTQIFINTTNPRRKKKKRVCLVSNFIHTGNGMQAFSLFPLHRQKVRDTRVLARKSLHAQIFIATSFWVEFSVWHTYETGLSSGQRLKSSPETPWGYGYVFWLVRAFPVLTPVQHGHHMLWIWAA